MSPLSGIQQTMPYGYASRVDLTPSELGPVPLPIQSPSEVGGVQQTGESFANMLSKMVTEVNNKQVAAHETVAQLQSGGNVPLHQAVIAMEEASLSFQLMVEVRNKLLEAYQEVMRMQV